MNELKVRFQPVAAEELEAAILWYRERSPRAAQRFFDEAHAVVAAVEEAPFRWPIFEGEARRILFPHFPYQLIYRIRPAWIEAIGLAHGRRRPGYWKSRTNS